MLMRKQAWDVLRKQEVFSGSRRKEFQKPEKSSIRQKSAKLHKIYRAVVIPAAITVQRRNANATLLESILQTSTPTRLISRWHVGTKVCVVTKMYRAVVIFTAIEGRCRNASTTLQNLSCKLQHQPASRMETHRYESVLIKQITIYYHKWYVA